MLLKRIFTLLFFIGFLHLAQSQKEAAIWYFGRNAGIDFNSGTPVALTDGALFTDEGCSTISDSAGNLLFYSDGITVWNRNHQIMVNGTGLLGHDSSTQSALIVPRPNTPNIYYIFTVDKQAGPNGMHYSEVDMTLDGGLGAITGLKNVRLMDRSTEKVTAVQNANGSDIWVIGHPWDSNRFYSYSVTAAGLNTTPVESPTPLTLTYPPNSSGTNASAGQLKVSPDGTKIAMCTVTEGVHVFDFDSQTGSIGNMIQISSRQPSYGLEFSPSGKRIYTTVTTPFSYVQPLYQYDLEAPDIAASETLIAEEWGMGYALQLAIDGKIYGIASARNFLYSIETPDALGAACNFVYNSVDLAGREGRAGLPPFIQSFFYVKLDVRNLCLGDLTEFYTNSSGPVLSVLWDFGDGNTSTLENPTHTYANAGDYTVSLTVTTASGTSVDSSEITISETPVANPVSNFELCSIIPNPVFDLSTKDIEVLGGQSPLVYELEYYPTLVDAEDRTNLLPLNYTNTNAVETLYVRVHNKDNKECYDITSFDLIVIPSPVLNLATDWTVCDTDTDGFYTFDLSQKDMEIYNGQDTGVFSVAYFETQADADANANPVGPSYTNTAPLEDIFFRIYNTMNPECYETGSFKIEVIAGVTANTPTNLVACDDDNDGIYIFDLSLAESEIIGTQNPASLNITYHASLLDAENGDNPLPNNYVNTVAYSETIYARVANTADISCYDTSSFELRVYDTPVLQQITDWQLCDDANDGLETFDLTEKNMEILGGQSASNFSISYYTSLTDADAGLNPITAPFENTVNPQQIFYRLENGIHTDCYMSGSFALELFTIPTAGIPGPLIVCDTNETGIQTFDLSTKDTKVLNGLGANDFDIVYFENLTDAHADQNPLSKQSYSNSATQETLYARIQNKGMESCYDISNFELIINPLPQPNLDTTYVICPDSPDLVIDGGDFESWSWQDANNTILGTARNIDITTLGDYTMTVTQTQNGISCEKMVAFEVVSSGAPEDFTTEIIGFSDTVTLEIDATGFGDFEYSVDGIDFQSDPRFEVFPGEHTVHVRDVFLCRTLSKEIIALGYQKFFTPNGDGNNEYWNVIGAEKYPESSLFIYDRYGKLVKQIVATGQGWDGTYNGAPLPASDYWFRYVYDDGKVFTGHFSLKR